MWLMIGKQLADEQFYAQIKRGITKQKFIIKTFSKWNVVIYYARSMVNNYVLRDAKYVVLDQSDLLTNSVVLIGISTTTPAEGGPM